jgi:hypothetical protein
MILEKLIGNFMVGSDRDIIGKASAIPVFG